MLNWIDIWWPKVILNAELNRRFPVEWFVSRIEFHLIPTIFATQSNYKLSRPVIFFNPNHCLLSRFLATPVRQTALVNNRYIANTWAPNWRNIICIRSSKNVLHYFWYKISGTSFVCQFIEAERYFSGASYLRLESLFDNEWKRACIYHRAD